MRAIAGLSWALLPAFCVSAAAQEARLTTIHLVVTETHDRLTPTPLQGIVKRHELTVVLKPNKQIDESFEQTDLTHERAHADPGGSRTTEMGLNNGKSVWHVLGPHRLQRVGVRFGELSMMTVTIENDHACRLDVRFMMKPGETVRAGKIAGTDIDATFGKSRLVSATCTIE